MFLFCSYGVKPTKRRFPPPWTVEMTEHGCTIKDANGISLAYVYCRDDLHKQRWANYTEHLTSDEARRIAKGIARLPEFLMHHPGFYSRDGGKVSGQCPASLRESRAWSTINPMRMATFGSVVSHSARLAGRNGVRQSCSKKEIFRTQHQDWVL